MALPCLAYWQDEICLTWGKFWCGLEPFSLSHSSFLSPSLWEKSWHDWNIVAWTLSLYSINQTSSPSQKDTNLSVSSLCLLFAPVPVVSLDSPVDVDGCGSIITWLSSISGTCSTIINTVKPVLSGHSKIDKTKAVKTNGSLMKVESIAECSLGPFCNTFELH